jgi:hypothetical protein
MIPLHTPGIPTARIGVKLPLFRGGGGVSVAPCLPLVRGLIGSYKGQMRGLWGLKQGVLGGYN